MVLKKENIIIAAIALVITVSVSAVLLCTFSRFEKDEISGDVNSEYHIDDENNYIEQQESDDCAAYAAAFVMRHFDDETRGSELRDEVERSLGFVSVNGVADMLREHGYSADAYSGSIDTLKMRLSGGAPVIAFMRTNSDTHYAAVVGYDDSYIYLADSLSAPAVGENDWYNRKLTTEEFEKLWNTDIYVDDNIYIVVQK